MQRTRLYAAPRKDDVRPYRTVYPSWLTVTAAGTRPLLRPMGPEKQIDKSRALDEFLELVSEQLKNIRPVNAEEGTRAVFNVLSRHLDRGQTVKVRDALPEEIRNKLWPEHFFEEAPSRQQTARERAATESH
jgi:hypothetical protein